MATATNLVDLAIELINEAKMAKDAKTKVYHLEQVKEIVLFRDTSLLVGLIPDITDFMTETALSLRKFLVKFCGDALHKSFLISAHVLAVFDYFVSDSSTLMSSSSEEIIRAIALQVRTHYPQLFLSVVELPLKTKTSSAHGPDAKLLWKQFRSICERVMDATVAANVAESTRLAGMKVMEAVIQFGIPLSEKAKVDPRLKAASKKNDAAKAELSSADIPLHHPFINRVEVEQEAEALFSKMLLWASRGGPQATPFNPNELSQLGQVIASMSALRNRLLGTAAPAVMSILTKAGVCEEMSGANRESFARSLHRMMRSLMAQTDANSKMMVPKIKASLQQLESLGFGTIEATSKKRDASSIEDEVEDLEQVELKSSALAALKSLEENMISKESMETESKLAETGNATSSKHFVFSISGETELPSHFNPPVDSTAFPKVADVQVFPSEDNANHFDVRVVPISLQERDYADIVTDSLARVLESTLKSKNREVNTMQAIRTCLALVVTEFEQNNYGEVVPVMSAVSAHAFAAKLMENIPVEVRLPKAIVFLLQFSLSPSSELMNVSIALVVDLMNNLLKEVYCRQVNYEVHSKGYVEWYKVFESICLVVFSRFLQNPKLRSHVVTIVSKLYFMPVSCIKFFRLLLLTGSKSSQSGSDDFSKTTTIRNESMNLLINLLTFKDEAASTLALNLLLWCTLSDDFEVRSKVIFSLTSIAKRDKSLFRYIAKFSLDALVALIGEKECKEWIEFHQTYLQSQEHFDKTAVDQYTHSGFHLHEFTSQFNNGGQYEGKFALEALTSDPKVDSRLRVYLQLFSQLCILEPKLIASFFDIYSCGIFRLRMLSESFSSDSTTESSRIQDCILRRETFEAVLDSDMKVITSAVLNNMPSSDLLMSLKYCGVQSFPLIQSLIAKIHSDFHVPATRTFVTEMKSIVKERVDIFLPIESGHRETYENPLVLEFFSPVVSGMTEEEIIEILPYLVQEYGNDSFKESLHMCFNRITQSRPPSMTKANLLVALHRMLEQNAVVDVKHAAFACGLCLEDKDEFRPEIVKDALTKLLSDSSLSDLLLRTAILSYQYHSELRTFVVKEMIPQVIRRQVWTTFPKLWEGVVYVVNKLHNFKDSDEMIKCVLSLPISQLQSLIVAAPSARSTLKQRFDSLGADKGTVLSGVYIDASANQSQSEKEQILKSLGDV